ncbi:Calcium-binding EF-hand [Corchorus capsularis]|uniref:Calcium-binding EF-hand n=1 Tax=Corchorus capsularis TaxID=210143 RepID=A0A1R3I8N5_COCAP|nr:Calcium-binding EF-hand [Corchorus capsularis]
MNRVLFVPKNVDKACQRPANNEWSLPAHSNSWRPAVVEKKRAAAVPVNEDFVRDVFRYYDADKDGRLSKKELQNAFSTMGSRFPFLRALLALRHADSNGDGYISEEEF